MILVLVCLPSDALSQHLPSSLSFSYLGRGVSLHSCSSKAQALLLTLNKVTPPDLECGVAPFGPPASTQLWLLGYGVARLGHHHWPRTWGSSSQPLLCGCSLVLSLVTPDLGRGVALLTQASAWSVAVGALLQIFVGLMLSQMSFMLSIFYFSFFFSIFCFLYAAIL